MDEGEIRKFLEAVKGGALTVESAVQRLKSSPTKI